MTYQDSLDFAIDTMKQAELGSIHIKNLENLKKFLNSLAFQVSTQMIPEEDMKVELDRRLDNHLKDMGEIK